MAVTALETSEEMGLLSGALQTGHVGLNVSDLGRSVRFYREVFGFGLLGRSDEPGREYAFLADGDGRLVLTLWRQSAGGFPTDRPGLHHLSFQVPGLEEVREAERRVRALGVRLYHDGVVPHGQGASSGGVFFEDPDGIRLEVFAPAGLEGTRAPASDAPTCGFF